MWLAVAGTIQDNGTGSWGVLLDRKGMWHVNRVFVFFLPPWRHHGTAFGILSELSPFLGLASGGSPRIRSLRDRLMVCLARHTDL